MPHLPIPPAPRSPITTTSPDPSPRDLSLLRARTQQVVNESGELGLRTELDPRLRGSLLSDRRSYDAPLTAAVLSAFEDHPALSPPAADVEIVAAQDREFEALREHQQAHLDAAKYTDFTCQELEAQVGARIDALVRRLLAQADEEVRSGARDQPAQAASLGVRRRVEELRQGLQQSRTSHRRAREQGAEGAVAGLSGEVQGLRDEVERLRQENSQLRLAQLPPPRTPPRQPQPPRPGRRGSRR